MGDRIARVCNELTHAERSSIARSSLFFFFLVSFFASDDFRLCAFSGRFLGFFDDDLFGALNDERFGVDEDLDAFRRDNVGDVNLLVEAEVVDVNDDLFGSARRFGFDLDLMQVLLDNAAVLETGGFAAEDDRDGKLNAFVFAYAREVDVKNDVAPGVPLDVFNERAFIDSAVKLDEAASMTKRGVDEFRRDREVHDFLFVSIKDGRGLAAFTKTTIPTFTDSFATFDRQC